MLLAGTVGQQSLLRRRPALGEEFAGHGQQVAKLPTSSQAPST